MEKPEITPNENINTTDNPEPVITETTQKKMRYDKVRYESLAHLGFSAENIDKIQRYDSYIPPNEADIVKRIEWLKENGFSDPVKIINKTIRYLALQKND